MQTTEIFGRRRFLKRSLLVAGGTATLCVGGFGYLTQTNIYRQLYKKLLVLDGHLADIAHALAEASLPTLHGFPTVIEAEVINRLDEELFFVSETISSDFKAALYLLEYMPLSKGYSSRFSRMAIAERKKFLMESADTNSDTLRVVVAGLPATMRWYYYGHPSTWKKIGYEGPFMNLPEQKSEQRMFYAAIADTASS